MKKTLIVFLLFVFGCSSNQENIPAGIIAPDSMASIMVDIHIAEASMPAMQIYGEKMNVVAYAHYEHIYELHNITKEEFKESYEYYINHPNEYRDIYDEVVSRLEKMKP